MMNGYSLAKVQLFKSIHKLHRIANIVKIRKFYVIYELNIKVFYSSQ